METLYRLVSGAAAGIAALFAPIGPLVACTVVFIGIDFLSGVAASRAAGLTGPPPAARGPAAKAAHGTSRAAKHGARSSSWASPLRRSPWRG